MYEMQPTEAQARKLLGEYVRLADKALEEVRHLMPAAGMVLIRHRLEKAGFYETRQRAHALLKWKG